MLGLLVSALLGHWNNNKTNKNLKQYTEGLYCNGGGGGSRYL